MKSLILLAILLPSLAFSSEYPVKEIAISLSGSDQGQIFSNGKNQIEIFVNVELEEGEEVDWIKLIREQDETDIQDLGWLYRSPLGETDEYYISQGKYARPNEFLKTTQGNPFGPSYMNQSYRIRSNSNIPSTYEYNQNLYLSTDIIHTADICAEVTLKSGYIETSCKYSEPSITVNAIAPNIIPRNQFSSTNIIDEDDIEEKNDLRHFTHVKALVGPARLDGAIHSVYIDNSPEDSQLLIYNGTQVTFAGADTSVYWSDNKTYHLSMPGLKYFNYLTLGRLLEIDLNSVTTEINSLASGSTHILNVLSIPYNKQGSTYDTIWVENGGVYKSSYNGCYFPPERGYISSNSETCSKDISEALLEEIKNRNPELVIVDRWGTEHRILIGSII
ncbi:hypothetical protein [Vibrio genomosp. F10]|uniref:hypothetical protein n=1 Tax=Vibrio genomosp. F10 TaxID=723171 RepID=UPI00031A1AF8|nr:hypothetical protein [Vibrio genomosp. F10]OEE98213.1 hypothetical protein A1QK_12420 [Vibrio genomosp. F10 str. 9ZD137]